MGGNPLLYRDPLGLWRLPDFVTFQIDFYVGSTSGTFNRSGNSFFGLGANRSFANSVSASANASVAWLNKCDAQATPLAVDSFLNEFSGGGAAAYVGLGGGILVSPGNGTATVIGIGAGRSVGSSSTIAGALGAGTGTNLGSTGLGGW